ncbi:MAG: MarC family protein [Acidobacteriota bacterium]
MTLASAIILLILVMDPLGNIPFFVSVLKKVPPERKRRVIARELVIALCVLVVFMFLGPQLLKLLGISGPSLSIAGGIVLLLIAIKMVFPSHDDLAEEEHVEPLVVPLAIPYVAGPSSLATVMLMASGEPSRWADWLLALVCAWLATGLVLLLSVELEKLLGKRGMVALERLMGMILTAIAVEMALTGIADFLAAHAAGK